MAPGPALAEAQIRPPWASMMERQIERPMPMPFALVVKKELNNWRTLAMSTDFAK